MAKRRRTLPKIGGWSFLVGLIVAVIVSITNAAQPPAWSVSLLAVLGLIVGFLNITAEEAVPFLIASIAFLISFQALAEALSIITFGVAAEGIKTFFNLVGVFIAPAAAVVAFFAIYHLARD